MVPKKIYPLNAVRFFAALLVLFHHSERFFLPNAASGISPSANQDAIDFSLGFRVSVSFFFVLSGYSLSLAYLRKEKPIDTRKFFAARFARIYPLYLLVLVLCTPVLLADKLQIHGMALGLVKTAAIFTPNAALLQAWYPAKLLLINRPSWSLCAEAFFYCCFPSLGTLLWKLRGRGLWISALALYVGGQALVWWMRPLIGSYTLTFFPLFHLSTFALGILVARWQSLRQERIDRTEVQAWQATLVLGLSVAGLLLSVPLGPLFHVDQPYDNGLLAPIFAGFIWSLSAASTPASRWLCGKWLVALGNGSFALYLIHLPIRNLFLHFGWVAPACYPIYVIVCVALSLVSFYYFETPVRQWLIKQFDERRRRNIFPELTTARVGSISDQ